ncbi:MAG TPA: magnesium transporter [Bacteroidales bacterium]|nr:magnesium transporter [Bacteroidales bacterium]
MVTIARNFIELIQHKDWKALKMSIDSLDAIDIANLIELLDEKDEAVVFRLLNRHQAKEVFQLLSLEKQQEIIEALAHNNQRLAELLNDIEPDDRTAFFEELPGNVLQPLLQLLSPEERSTAVRLLGYPDDSVGRLMTPEYVALRPDWTIERCFDHIRQFGRDSETLNVVYVVDDQWKLIDDIKIRELIFARPDQLVRDLMDFRFIALKPVDDQETAVRTFKDYDRVALPVVNDEGVLIGIVTVDDIMDVLEKETTEDFHKFGSVGEALGNPLRQSVAILYKNRILWLIALVFVNVFSGAALASFEGVIQSMVSLVFFLPLLIDSGGNAGSQSATLMIRSLAVGDVKLSDWYKLLGKEFLVSFLLGLTMAVGVAAVASFRSPGIIPVVALTMVLVVINGSMIGMLLPFVFTRLKIDPAAASAPLITSIADITGVIIYFSVANWYLG